MDQDTPPSDASDAIDTAAWLATVESIGENAGYFQSLGARHFALFTDDSTTLLVTFDTIDDARGREGQMPLGHSLARSRNWSHLCILADGPTWFRDPAVWSFFDRLVEDAFFEDFDHVVFHGTGMGAYAACAYSVTAPEATVIAVRPRATLDPRCTGWDERDKAQRRLDFTSRYGFAPDMVEGAGGVFILFDPKHPADAAHAAMFRSPNVTHLPCRAAGADLDLMLEEMAILPRLLEMAIEGRMCSIGFARLWRERHGHGPYLRALLAANRAPKRRHVVLGALRRL